MRTFIQNLGTIFLLVVLVGLFLGLSGLGGSPALELWDDQSKENMPTALLLWLVFMGLSFAASLFFMRNHSAPRWIAAGFVCSHIAVALAESRGIAIRAGLISLLHLVFWTPGLLVLLRRRQEIIVPSAYGLWACAILLVYAVSFTLDIRDSVVFLDYLLLD